MVPKWLVAALFPLLLLVTNALAQPSIGAEDVNAYQGGSWTNACTQSGTWDINDISGTISLPAGAATAANQLADGHNVTVDNAGGASAVNVQDGGNVISVDDNAGSLTVDGTLTCNAGAGTFDVDVVSNSIGLATSAGQLPDGHAVTVDNAGGASAVNIQDGGNSITIDGTVSVNQPVSIDDNGGSITVDNAALSVTGGGTEASALRVTLANNSTGLVSVDDNGGSLSVDGTVAATQSGTWDINDITGTVPLPTGAATAANQLADGHNVTVDNTAGTNPLPVEGDQAEGVDLDTTPVNPVVMAGKAFSTNLISIPTMLSVAGIDVFGALPLDLTGNSATVSNSAWQCTGDEAHDAPNAGNPILAGGVGYDMTPDTLDTEAGPAGVSADDDRTELTLSAKGFILERPVAFYEELDNVDTTYNDVTANATSQTIEVWGYRACSVSYDLTESGSGTDIEITVQASNNDTDWYDYVAPSTVVLFHDDAAISNETTLSRTVPFPVTSRYVRFFYDATNTSASNTITADDSQIYCRN